jgi:hypothetical protein
MNLTEMSLTELTRLRRDVLAAIASKRPKPVKVKVRKVVSAEERERARLYAEWKLDHDGCMLCERTASDKPSWWHGPFFVERMHIVNKPRVEDVRVILAACSLCHRLQHGATFSQIPGLKPLTITELLRVKKFLDPDNYDPEFLQKHSIRKLVFPTP